MWEQLLNTHRNRARFIQNNKIVIAMDNFDWMIKNWRLMPFFLLFLQMWVHQHRVVVSIFSIDKWIKSNTFKFVENEKKYSSMIGCFFVNESILYTRISKSSFHFQLFVSINWNIREKNIWMENGLFIFLLFFPSLALPIQYRSSIAKHTVHLEADN